MGNLIWHDFARIVAITASVCEYSGRPARRGVLTAPAQTRCGPATGACSTASSSGTWSAASCATPEDSSAWPRVCARRAVLTARRAPNGQGIFITLIVKMPVIQLLTMFTGFAMLAFELTPPAKLLAVGRSFVPRVVLLLFQTFFAILFYQVGSSRRIAGGTRADGARRARTRRSTRSSRRSRTRARSCWAR
jgi:hypothetical protein